MNKHIQTSRTNIPLFLFKIILLFFFLQQLTTEQMNNRIPHVAIEMATKLNLLQCFTALHHHH